MGEAQVFKYLLATEESYGLTAEHIGKIYQSLLYS